MERSDSHESGQYTWSTTNAVGCDSTATLDLTILNSTTLLTTVAECIEYTWNGSSYSVRSIHVVDDECSRL